MDALIVLLLLITAYFTGRGLEKKHYRSIIRREKASQRMIIITSRTVKFDQPIQNAALVTGSVVVSIDYFKKFLANLRNIFGGRVKSYETILDRGRREAVLRMKEDARTKGATMIINTRMETASIAKHRGKQGVGAIEVVAYGTALKVG